MWVEGAVVGQCKKNNYLTNKEEGGFSYWQRTAPYQGFKYCQDLKFKSDKRIIDTFNTQKVATIDSLILHLTSPQSSLWLLNTHISLTFQVLLLSVC